MDNKIQELTEKIYREGVEKGNEEARQITAEARTEAQRITDNAAREAEALLAAARKEAEELKENTRSELRLYASQAVNALKAEITTLVTHEAVSKPIKDLTKDKDFLNTFIVALASKWTENEPIVISTADADALKAYFTAKAKALLDKGVKIEQVNGLKTLFNVSPANGSYKVAFGEEEFMNYFKAFVRPQLAAMLF